MSQTKSQFTIQKISSLVNGLVLINADANSVLVSEIEEHSYGFEGPSRACVLGQLISVEGLLLIDGVENDFYSTGKVVEVVVLDARTSKYRVELYRHESALWQQYLNALAGQQVRIDRLFSSMRDLE